MASTHHLRGTVQRNRGVSLSVIGNFASRTSDVARSLRDASGDLFRPGLRLGVTGLSRSGKTVFTTAIVHHLVGGRSSLPAFRVAAEGRLRRAILTPQPDDAVPRFPYENHIHSLTADRNWPASTTQISELRLDIEYERRPGWRGGQGHLVLDIVDYPGEWLLDLALLGTSYAEWSQKTIAASRRSDRAEVAEPWLANLDSLDPAGPADEVVASRVSALFKDYLLALHAKPQAVATMPPGRFLMPGDLAGAPALTFAPLAMAPGVAPAANSLAQLMERRFEAYKQHVVKPFFRDQFSAH